MKHRITFLTEKCPEHENAALNSDRMSVKASSLSVNNICGAKEYRLTIGLSELPDHILSVLKQSHELHIRWSSPRPYLTVYPLVSRVPSGLHVLFTPQNASPKSEVEALCSTLRSVFTNELKCDSYETSFTTPSVLSTRFATSASSQFFGFLPSLEHFVRYLQGEICSSINPHCQKSALSLLSTSVLDVDYDAISQVLVLTSYWEKGQASNGAWNDEIEQIRGDQIEVGILRRETSQDAEEVTLSGFLTVIGQDQSPKPTRFSFPSRHQAITTSKQTKISTFSTRFEQPTNLHPVLHLTIDNASSLKPPMESCALHAYFTFPSVLFLDRHAFSDVLFLRSHNLASLRSLNGATDLEAPEWATKQWGSAALFELAVPQDKTETRDMNTHNIKIPLHARYLNPTPGGHVNISIPYPSVFWACKAETGSKFPVNPFDRRNLGFDGLFGDRTLFYHLEPRIFAAAADAQKVSDSPNMYPNSQVTQTVNILRIPTLDLDKSAPIETGTVIGVLLGFLWVSWSLFKRC